MGSEKFGEVRYKRLIVPFGMVTEIGRAVQCSAPTVREALAGRITGPKSKAARGLAVAKLREIEGFQDSKFQDSIIQ